MATHSSTLAWKIPWVEEPGRLQSMGLLSQTWLSDSTFTSHFHALEKEMATHSSVLAWRIPGTGEPGRLPSMGLHRVRHDWSDLAIAHSIRSWEKKRFQSPTQATYGVVLIFPFQPAQLLSIYSFSSYHYFPVLAIVRRVLRPGEV